MSLLHSGYLDKVVGLEVGSRYTEGWCRSEVQIKAFPVDRSLHALQACRSTDLAPVCSVTCYSYCRTVAKEAR